MASSARGKLANCIALSRAARVIQKDTKGAANDTHRYKISWPGNVPDTLTSEDINRALRTDGNTSKGINMTNIRKGIVAGMIVLGLGGASIAAYADRGGCGPMGAGPASFGERGRSPEQMKAHFEKRKTDLHDKLKLNASQEAAWKNYLGKVGPMEPGARPDRAEMQKLSAPERMEKMLGFMKERENRMANVAAATKEFYAVLTPEQQKVFNDEFGGGYGHGKHRRGPF